MGEPSCDASIQQAIEQSYVHASASCPPTDLGRDGELERVLFWNDPEELYDVETSGLQSGCSILNVRKARALAQLLVSETGEVLVSKIHLAKQLLESRLYTLGPGCEELRKRDMRLLKALKFLSENAEAQRLIRKMSRPLSNRLAENAVRDTLLLPENQPVHDGHVRRAVVASLITTLRQSLGSCFATAPAIAVHEEQPLVFLSDLDELMGTAKLKRTVSGNEYAVPMSSSWGQGDLKRFVMIADPLSSSPQPIWRSPTLASVLQALEIMPQGLSRDARIAALLKVLEAVLEGRTGMITVDDILQLILMKKMGISEKELRDFKSRPKALRQTSLVVTTTAPTGARADQEKLFQRFFALLDTGRRLFKAEADCALLKSWEFTIASFSEVKFELCRWNFYSSLGVNWDDAGGIGQVLYEIAKQRVDETNLELEQHRQKFDAISLELDYLARRIQQASSESEAQWIKMEHQSRQVEQYNIKELCDMATEKANKIAKVHQFLIDRYEKLMQDYFQEVYDADLHDVQAGPFDDSPAGFRLLYKHGRSNPSLWTKIDSLDGYVDALVAFVTTTEQELLHEPEIKGIETEFSSIITRLANHIRSEEFIISALRRTALAHGVRPIENPLQNLDALEKKPWVYTSGGSMNTLVTAYFGLESPPETSDRWVENEVELLAFLIDATRLSMSRAGRYRAPYILMHSPTHAFLEVPSFTPFEESWSGDVYSYSWINNYVRDPSLAFYSSCVLNQDEVIEFCSLLTPILPKEIQKRFMNEAPTIPGFLRPYELAREIQRLFALDYTLRGYLSVVQGGILDAMIFESVPYTPLDALNSVLVEILSTTVPKGIRKNTIEKAVRESTSGLYRPIRSKDLLRLVITLMLRITNTVRYETDMLAAITKVMRAKKLLPPMPLLVADSNWVKDLFAFLIGPTSQQLELWSVNAYATEGQPIPHWKMWLNGSRKDRTWGLLINPTQYRAAAPGSALTRQGLPGS